MRDYVNLNNKGEVDDHTNINIELRNQLLEQLHNDISELLESDKKMDFLTDEESTEIGNFDYRVQQFKNKKGKTNPLPQKKKKEILVEIFNNNDDGVLDSHLKRYKNNQPEL